MQIWPALAKPPRAVWRAASSTSPSARSAIGELPPSSSESLLDAGHARDGLAHRGRAGERDLAHPPVGAQGRAEGRAVAGEALQAERRQARLEEDLGQLQGRQRGGRGGLEDDRVARRQRGRDLVQGEQHREVERGDRDHHAARHAQRQAELAGAVGRGVERQHLAAQLGALERRPAGSGRDSGRPRRGPRRAAFPARSRACGRRRRPAARAGPRPFAGSRCAGRPSARPSAWRPRRRRRAHARRRPGSRSAPRRRSRPTTGCGSRAGRCRSTHSPARNIFIGIRAPASRPPRPSPPAPGARRRSRRRGT